MREFGSGLSYPPRCSYPFFPMNFRESIGRFSSAPYLEVMVDVKRPSIDKTLIEFDQPNSQAQAFGGGGFGWDELGRCGSDPQKDPLEMGL